MTESQHNDYCLAAFGEAFPGEVRNQEERDGDRLRAFLVDQLLSKRPKPNRPVFEDE